MEAPSNENRVSDLTHLCGEAQLNDPLPGVRRLQQTH
uniref:Uncharacterized protein n=1 Tax=Anguilla anguilla TaxID=7936 RepID=A0A0E9QEH3_ANGAN